MGGENEHHTEKQAIIIRSFTGTEPTCFRGYGDLCLSLGSPGTWPLSWEREALSYASDKGNLGTAPFSTGI